MSIPTPRNAAITRTSEHRWQWEGVLDFFPDSRASGAAFFSVRVLIMLQCAGLRRTAAVAAAFILLNSIAGLAGYLQKGGAFPEHIALWSVAVVFGGFIGSTLGATKFNSPVLRVLLSVMLVMAGMKLVLV
jgi:uncharacterized membrane protein YfcA